VELGLGLGSIFLPGLAGTILGWLGWREIRESAGRVQGVPVAMFATLAWPVAFALVLVIAAAGLVTATRSHPATLRAESEAIIPHPRDLPPFQSDAELKSLQSAGDDASIIAPRTTRPGRVLAHSWLKSPAPGQASNAVQFTFTGFELRQDGGRQWLAMDYATDVRGECQEMFVVDGPGVPTRKHGLLVTPEGSPPVLRQRFEWQLPDQIHTPVGLQLSEALAKTLVGKSVLIPAGEQRPLFALPMGATGEVTTSLGATLQSALP
jgi:hypothetical protein